VTHQGTLQVGDSYDSGEITVTIPSDWRSGSGEFFLTVQADAGGAVTKQMLDANVNPDDPHELDSDTWKARPITVLGGQGEFDLAVSNVRAPMQAPAGGPFQIQWDEANLGVVASPSFWSDQVILSPTPNRFDPNAQNLGFFSHSSPLQPGQVQTFGQAFSLPPNAAGQFVFVVASASGDPFPDNNMASAPTNVTPLPPANLHVQSVMAPDSPSGEAISVTYTVSNDGGDVWAGTQSWGDNVYLSTDPVFYPNRATLQTSFTHQNTTPLKHGQTYTGRATFTLPRGVAGTYYVYVVPNKAFNFGTPFQFHAYQADDNDDAKHLGGGHFQVTYAEPDLKIGGLSAPTTLQAGAPIHVEWTVTNVGSRDTREGFWFDAVYLSRDPSLSAGAVQIGTVSHFQPLSKNAGQNSYVGKFDGRVPDGIEGDFYVVVFTDAPGSLSFPNTGNVPEFAGEGNNIITQPLHVARVPLADLRVTQVTAPERVSAGQSFDVTYTVTNEGAAATLPNQFS
jgi:hypothetical protein